MGEIERLARLMAKAMHADLEPDARVAVGAPRLLNIGYVVPHQMDTTPLWATFVPAARALLNDREWQRESGK